MLIVIAFKELCASANEEPLHWRTVLQLHRSLYSLPGPFTIPSPTSSFAVVDQDEPNDSQVPLERPSSPITASSAPSSAFSSPTKARINPQVGTSQHLLGCYYFFLRWNCDLSFKFNYSPRLNYVTHRDFIPAI